MEDYEMGRLAEELIEKRFEDKLKMFLETSRIKDNEIVEIEKELSEEKNKKVYYKQTISMFSHRSFDTYEEISVDDITKELKKSSELLEKTNKDLDIVAKVNLKYNRFVYRNKLATYLYKKWSDKVELTKS